jgi:hypothetical protein
MESLDVLEYLFRLVPNLLELDTAGIEKNSQSDKTFKLLSHLQMVSTELDDPLDLHDLAFLSALPNLTTLKIYKWPVISEDYFEEEEEASFTFPTVSILCVEGDGGDDKSIQTLVKLCPNLLHLHLRTNYQEESAFDSALMDLPTSISSSLQSLSLQATFRMVSPDDGLLLPFTQLRSLDLGDECFSYDIHTTLVRLPLLVKLRLGQGTIDPIGFLSIFSGPTRLANLQQITLDFDAGEQGGRVSSPRAQEVEASEKMDDWRLSRDLDDGDEWNEGYVVELQHLIHEAEHNGIKIEGTVHDALVNYQDYWIEANNRGILGIYYNAGRVNFASLRNVRLRAIGSGVTLPALDVDSLDLARLKLVKIDLPKRDWYMYTLSSEGVGNSEVLGWEEGNEPQETN